MENMQSALYLHICFIKIFSSQIRTNTAGHSTSWVFNDPHALSTSEEGAEVVILSINSEK